jgi:hypothetical protein
MSLSTKGRFRAVFLSAGSRTPSSVFVFVQLCYLAVIGEIELALHSLNDGSQDVASLLSIGSAKLDASDCPIRFYARLWIHPLHEHANEGLTTWISFLDSCRDCRLNRLRRNEISVVD